MFRRMLLLTLVLGVSCSLSTAADQTPKQPALAAAQEYPIILEKGLSAGKTPVGTKIQGKLLMATLVNGKVVPRNAIFSGEVIESQAKTKTDPSRLSILMDLVTWKQGSAAVRVYLTSWYYPTVADPGQPLQYGPEQPPSRTWDGKGQYPDANNRVYHPFPGSEPKDQPVPTTANPVASSHRVLMENIQSEPAADGAIVLVSKRSNIKLDHVTTYVFANQDLTVSK